MPQILWDFQSDTVGYTSQETLDYIAYFITVSMTKYQRRILEEELRSQQQFFGMSQEIMPVLEFIDSVLRLMNIRKNANRWDAPKTSVGSFPQSTLLQAITGFDPKYQPTQKKTPNNVKVQCCNKCGFVRPFSASGSNSITTPKNNTVSSFEEPEEIICLASDDDQQG
eukprot:TRINITY_DN127750_c0_g1_i1.p3 TRINITY_DN127750_c0_g1~~TRINITY_DN127750_c0_g1_i1.p3  ORF type:complete len:168 (+),score=3.84 TRINITY_DN127750_c0_g1_i1:1513-2016(+)